MSQHVHIDTNSVLRGIDEINSSGIITDNMDVIHVTWDVVAMFPNIPGVLGVGKCKDVRSS